MAWARRRREAHNGQENGDEREIAHGQCPMLATCRREQRLANWSGKDVVEIEMQLADDADTVTASL
jgi:hypothetical protein